MAPSSVRSVDVAGPGRAEQATRNATSLADLIATIPQVWRPVLGGHLTKVYRLAQKLCNVQDTISQYDKHTADGSFPPSIRNSIKDPKIQFSKEFLGTSDGALSRGLLESAVHDARKSLLAVALQQKKGELATLQSQSAFDALVWRKLIAETSQRVATPLGLSVEVKSPETPPDWAGSNKDAIQAECTGLWNNGSVFHYRVVSLARSAADRTLLDRVKVMTLKSDTDVKMKDADVELSTRDVVRDEMQAQMRLLEQRLAKSLGHANKAGGKGKPKKTGSNPSRVTKGKPKAKPGKGKKGR